MQMVISTPKRLQLIMEEEEVAQCCTHCQAIINKMASTKCLIRFETTSYVNNIKFYVYIYLKKHNKHNKTIKIIN